MTLIFLWHLLLENVFYILKTLLLTYVSIFPVMALLEADGLGQLGPCPDKALVTLWQEITLRDKDLTRSHGLSSFGKTCWRWVSSTWSGLEVTEEEIMFSQLRLSSLSFYPMIPILVHCKKWWIEPGSVLGTGPWGVLTDYLFYSHKSMQRALLDSTV